MIYELAQNIFKMSGDLTKAVSQDCPTVFKQIYCDSQVIYTVSVREDILLWQSQCIASEVTMSR